MLPPPPKPIWYVRLGQKVAGAVTGLFTAAFIMVYQNVVETAAPGSLPVRAFTAAAQGGCGRGGGAFSMGEERLGRARQGSPPPPPPPCLACHPGFLHPRPFSPLPLPPL